MFALPWVPHSLIRIYFSISVKSCVGIFMCITLNIYIAFGKMTTLSMLIFPTHDQGILGYFHFSQFSVSSLKFLEYFSVQVFHFFAYVYSNIYSLDTFYEDILNDTIYLISFSISLLFLLGKLLFFVLVLYSSTVLNTFVRYK